MAQMGGGISRACAIHPRVNIPVATTLIIIVIIIIMSDGVLSILRGKSFIKSGEARDLDFSIYHIRRCCSMICGAPIGIQTEVDEDIYHEYFTFGHLTRL